MSFLYDNKEMRPFPIGYSATSTERINPDFPLLQIGNHEAVVSVTPIQSRFPENLTIKAKINPVKGNNKTAEVMMFRQGRPFDPCMIYQSKNDMGENGFYESVQILFESVLERSVADMDIMNTVLFEKQFVTQGDLTHVIHQDLIDKKVIVTPPGRENGQPIWGYGGYYRDFCSPDQIEQILFMPVIEGVKTRVFLTRASVWTKEGSRSNPRAILMDEISFSNLAGDIETGKTVLNVSIGVDESGNRHFQQYTSFAFKQQDVSTNYLEINFQKGESYAHRLP